MNISINVFGYEDETSYHIYTLKKLLKKVLTYCYHRILKITTMY